MVGGGEILRDEQIYLAHKCANPSKYPPPESTLDDRGRAQIKKYKPTDVQIQVWDDLCHVAPTLSFTKPAKYMYRSVSQFSAWALARAQKRDIDILDDDDISIISTSSSDSDKEEITKVKCSLILDHGNQLADTITPSATRKLPIRNLRAKLGRLAMLFHLSRTT